MNKVHMNVAAALLVSTLAAFPAHAQAQAASKLPAPQTLAAPGLSQPVEIIKDKWGISHIYAQNESDLFFAQGYNAARDRLFQFEMWRRQAHGILAEVLGPDEVKRDIGNRLFKYRGDMKAEMEIYHPRGAQIVASFVAGVNAYIAETEKNPALLPPEFKLLGFKPGPWTVETVITRFNALAVNSARNEILTAQAVAAIGADAVKDLQYYQNGNPDLKMDPAIDVALLTDNVLDIYSARLAPVRFKPEQIEAGSRRTASLEAPGETLMAAAEYVEPHDPRADQGSNNWVVNGNLTTSGYPLVVGDPHRNVQIPSVRYWVHLHAPGWNAIGAGEATVPGVSIGHNEFGSWGLTIFGTDMEDIYVYDINPANPMQYRYKGNWETMTELTETINVKGAKPETARLMFTRHGPVLSVDKAKNKAFALRAAWLEPGGAPYMASLRMSQAKNVKEFLDAASYMRVPSENMIWGDREGNIAYQATAIQPRRPNWSGLVPVPGDGRYEWSGFLPVRELPQSVNPPKNFLNTSNENQIPPNFPHKDAVGFTWTDPYRGWSVHEVLASGRKFNVADMTQLQNNDYSIPARNLVPLLRDLPMASPVSQTAADRLLAWNYVLDKNSVEAGIYEMFQRQLIANVRTTVIPPAAAKFIGPGAINIPMVRTIALVVSPDGRFGADPLAGRNALLEKSLNEAVAELTKRLGPDMEKWKLGAYHHARIVHPLSGVVSPALEEKFNVGPIPRGGDAYTISATGGGDNQTGGGSFKLVIDTENWDNSVGMNTPGQSGNPDDPHYRDLFKLWGEGRYFPVAFSRAKVESVANNVFMLSPK